MKIITNSIKEGYFEDEFGKFGHKNEHGIPDVQFRLRLLNIQKKQRLLH